MSLVSPKMSKEMTGSDAVLGAPKGDARFSGSFIQKIKPADEIDRKTVEQADDVATYNTGKLIDWCEQSLQMAFVDYKGPFEKQAVDGPVFCMLNEDHLKEMAPEARIGDRLKLLALRDRMVRAARISRRNRKVLEGECRVEPPYGKGVMARYVLTNGSIKIVYRHVAKKGHRNPKTGDLSSNYNETVTEFMDNIDFSGIADVDYEETVETKKKFKLIRTQKEVRGWCGSKMVHVNVQEPDGSEELGVSKLYLRLHKATGVVGGHEPAQPSPVVGADGKPTGSQVNLAPANEAKSGPLGALTLTEFLVLTVRDNEKGQKLYNTMQDLMHEVQDVQITTTDN